MEEQYKDSLLEAQVALEMHQNARVKEILGTLGKTYLPYDLRLKYLFFLGQAEVELHECEAGREHLLEALALLEKDILADPLQVERVRFWVGHSFYGRYLFQQALEQYRLCWEGTLGDRITDQRFKLRVITTMASSYLGLKNYKNAIRTYKEALLLAKVGEDDQTRASSYWGMAMAYKETSKLPAATGSLMRCAGIYERIGAKPFAARAKALLSQVLTDRKLFDKALDVLEEAVALTPPDDSLTLSVVYINRAYTYFCMEQYKQAIESCEISIANARKQQDNLMLGQGLTQLGMIYWGLKDGNQALTQLQESIEVLKKTEDKIALSKAYTRYSEISREMGLFEEAFEALEAAYNS
jgi:tetratricopeptide (TPR) repeat protein